MCTIKDRKHRRIYFPKHTLLWKQLYVYWYLKRYHGYSTCCYSLACLRLAFIKKFDTVVRSSPNSSANAICISLVGFFVSLKMANSALFCNSVNCRRTFLGLSWLSSLISMDSEFCRFARLSSSLAAKK